MNITIRSTERCDAIYRLHRECFDSELEAPEAVSAFWLAHDINIGEPVGFAVAYEDYLDQQTVINFSAAGVIEDYRGHGIHRRLIRARLNYANKYNLKAITWTHVDNTPSSNNLIETGFKLYRPKWLFEGPEVNYWYHPLTGV